MRTCPTLIGNEVTSHLSQLLFTIARSSEELQLFCLTSLTFFLCPLWICGLLAEVGFN